LPNATAIARVSEEQGTPPQSVAGKYGTQFGQAFKNLVTEIQGRLKALQAMQARSSSIPKQLIR
jgi:hypothetical protein